MIHLLNHPSIASSKGLMTTGSCFVVYCKLHLLVWQCWCVCFTDALWKEIRIFHSHGCPWEVYIDFKVVTKGDGHGSLAGILPAWQPMQMMFQLMNCGCIFICVIKGKLERGSYSCWTCSIFWTTDHYSKVLLSDFGKQHVIRS